MTQDNGMPEYGAARCANLRSKRIIMNLPFHPSGIETEIGTPCWCFQTQQVFGPDGKIASVGDCTKERPCYEAQV